MQADYDPATGGAGWFKKPGYIKPLPSISAVLGTGPLAPPSDINVGGSTPDYNALINSDPGYSAWKAARTGREGDLATNRAAAIRSLALKYGGLPKDFVDKYGDLRPEDLLAAQQNPMSIQSQIAKGYQQAVDTMHRSLAGRGMLQSGELDYGQQQADFGKAQEEYTTGTDFGDMLTNAISDYTTGMSNIAGEEPGVIAAAEGDVYSNYKPEGSQPAHIVTGSYEQYGYPVYQDATGSKWRIDPTTGAPTPFSEPQQSPSAAAGSDWQALLQKIMQKPVWTPPSTAGITYP